MLQGCLSCEHDHSFDIRDGIPRFVPAESYTSSFGFEWARYARTQLDSAGHGGASEERLQASLDFPLADLGGKLVLDAGCGMGRFSEVAAKYGATIVAADMSRAVDVARRNLAQSQTVDFVQADLGALPFRPRSFDLVFCLGVLHHTPDAHQTFLKVARMVKPGGKYSITVYSAYNRTYVVNSRFWRSITTRLPLPLLHVLSYAAAPLYYLWTLPGIGLIFRSLAFISLERDWRWRVLDTFDWYSPRYQSWHTHLEVFGWFREAGFSELTPLQPSISVIGRAPESVSEP
ncbi:MAG: methyltransferase domain-containing protein [Acetobacteraceae bacterium]|nr:methyltransferase domain-containing protein [Acetobacteraceae bacterium]